MLFGLDIFKHKIFKMGLIMGYKFVKTKMKFERSGKVSANDFL